MKRKFPIVPVVIAAVAFLALAAVLVTVVGGDDESSTSAEGVEEFRPVAVDGDTLPDFDRAVEPDAAVGQPAPQLEGATFAGSPLTIGDDGRGKLIVFVAHWCPHCQAEVPVIKEWLGDRGRPTDVDLYTVSTGASDDRPNWPPSRWLEREGWTIPTLVDDARSTAGAAFGLTSYPFFVAVDADGKVVARGSGELAPEDLDALIATIS